MTKEELIKFLEENLRLECRTEMSSYGHGGGTSIELYLEKEIITTTYLDLPGCNCRCQ